MEENISQKEKEKAEEEMIEQAFQELLNDYLATKHRKRVEIITKAFNFANQAHKGIKRRSGEPYIMHPIAVAKIVCNEIGLGSTSICSALLHDVVEDTDYTVEDIENIFGPKIAQIVDGLTKISGGIFGDRASAQAENFKKLLLTMSDDIRVILIKIADRLHNMRTLGSMLPNKQFKIAGETLYIYAPLANRLGLYKIKTELENLSFKYEHPEEYHEIEEKLEATAVERDKVFNEFTAPIRAQLDKMGLKYRILARVKSIYSIWNKMQTKHVPFEEIYDLLAVRIIFEPRNIEEELNDCFDIYVSISKIYKPHPDRLRDWVSHPKANGYQALHVTLMGNNGQWIEVQIRSERMNDVAEQGFAAHWKYKEGEEYSEDEGEFNDWLSTIKEILDDPQPDAMDFLDAIKLNLFASEIFVFTPKGEIITMPTGCTALDFAFQIHTFLGSHCIGAKVNHKLVPLSHKLQSGDQVEILTSKSQHVQPSWINFVSTAKARGKILAILRRDNRESQKKGEEILTAWLKKHDMELSTSVLDKLCEFHDVKKHEDLLQAIGEHNILPGEKDHDELLGKSRKEGTDTIGWRKYVPFMGKDRKKDKEPQTDTAAPNLMVVDENFNKKKPIIVSEQNFSRFIMPDCCHPIPGDDIMGYIDNQNRIELHKRSCPVAAKLKSSFGNRIVDAKWEMHKQLLFDATIQLRGIDRMGMLLDVSKVISDQLAVSIHKITFQSDDGIFDGSIELRVHDREDVRVIMNNLKKIEGLQEIQQII